MIALKAYAELNYDTGETTNAQEIRGSKLTFLMESGVTFYLIGMSTKI